ncbi:SNF2 family N-terminal domain-containing protein [Phyllosticta citrichinensis]
MARVKPSNLTMTDLGHVSTSGACVVALAHVLMRRTGATRSREKLSRVGSFVPLEHLPSFALRAYPDKPNAPLVQTTAQLYLSRLSSPFRSGKLHTTFDIDRCYCSPAMDSDRVAESPPKRRTSPVPHHNADHKRQKTSPNGGYNSSQDSGDDLFDEHTIATLPLTSSFKPQQAQSPHFSSGANGAPNTTQPTQILDTPIARRTDPNSVVQVAASSPLVSNRAATSPFTSPTSKHRVPGIAPPGTSFRPPPRVSSAQTQPDYDSPIVDSSDDDRATSKAEIKPSLVPPKLKAKIPPPPNAAPSAFQSMMNSFRHDDGKATRSAPPKRPQDGPAVDKKFGFPEMTARDIADFMVMKKVERMALTFSNKNIYDLYNAIMVCRGEPNDAMAYLVEQEEKERQNQQKQASTQEKKPQRETIDLTSSDNDESLKNPAPKTSTTLKKDSKSTKSLNDKWGVKAGPSTTAQRAPAKRTAPADDDADSSPVKPVQRRRLVKGTRPTRESSPEIQESPKPVQSREKNFITIDSEPESDAAETPEEQDEDAGLDSDDRILKWINTCEPRDLADTSNQPLDVAEGLLAMRPFKSLEAVRKADISPPPTGKRRTVRKTTGEKVMDVVEEMWVGYEAIDELVAECTSKGRPIAAEMKKWGIDIFGTSKDGELAITNLEEAAKHDSGIGTPASSAPADDDDEVASKRKSKFLQKPSIMANDLVLKDYQIVGLNWLKLIWSQKMSCILADEMGLGKTCQVIAFLTHLYEIGHTGPHLIIVPGSTLENWLIEINKFSPELGARTQPYYGSQADRADLRAKIEDERDSISIVVTTYDTACRNKEDNKFLRILSPQVCAFDEAHVLRNSQSKRYKELMRIPAEFRLLLTGTPLQNNLQELVSLLAFLMPDVFSNHEEYLQYIFKNKAKTTDDDHGALLSARRIEKARSMMTPFILRRKKQQVLKSMPSKFCRVEYCDLLPSQKRIYDEYLARQQKVWDDKLAGKPKTDSANVMMKLRQAAIHPLLHRRIYDDEKIAKMTKEYIRKNGGVYQDAYEDLEYRDDMGVHEACLYFKCLNKYALNNEEWMDSGKVQKLKELLVKFRDNGDRVLVFSQFTRVMDILEHVLTTLDMQALRLDGSTPIVERQDLINRFNHDPSIPVFMLSTRSGGTGINLACANKVIIFDSSFNPQDDIQAENRAHRVGQTREVEVIRLVTKSTIEEQIHALGESKLALDARVAGEEAANGEDSDAPARGRRKAAAAPKQAIDPSASLNKADKRGLAMVEQMMMQCVEGQNHKDEDGGAPNEDTKMEDAEAPSSTGQQDQQQQDSLKVNFKEGLKQAGVSVAESQ